MTTKQKRECKYVAIRAELGNTEEPAMIQAWDDLMAVGPGETGRVSDQTLSEGLRALGYELSDSTVRDHRRRCCVCYR
jgi:hypothetical protein